MLCQAAPPTLLGWNNLGMHCMDSDYSVFSILPPYNTIECQLVVAGKLVTNASYSVTYEAVADPSGSINKTSIGKGNFYEWVQPAYGATLAPDHGLAGWSMPGQENTPLSMVFERTNSPAPGMAARVNWWRAEGIPITPFDDAFQKNPYPLMRLKAWSGAAAIATNDVVLPVSDEMDCRACHASGSMTAARPEAGWVWSGSAERDYRLNILRLHDERQFATQPELYEDALAANHFNSAGLYRSVTADQRPVLCALCHASEALGLPSFGTIPSLTSSVHLGHAGVTDPELNISLNDSANRAACYRCHPGAETKCLRGAMGSAVGADGKAQMQCQSCHGRMSDVGAPSRTGWFEEPNCQGCHTGSATSNSGAIRFTSVFTNSPTGIRIVTNTMFATAPNTPAIGTSLYRFSAGHGGLQCSACHGSTHAEFPSSHANDNVGSLALQRHAGVMVQCDACHTGMPNTGAGGPHGMHSIGQGWIDGTGGVTKHADRIAALGGVDACRKCHGANDTGTELSRAHTATNLTASFDGVAVSFPLFRGAEVGCHNCHLGPTSSNPNTAAAPSVSNLSTNVTNDKTLAFALGPVISGVTYRIISQPSSGSVGLVQNVATYFPAAGFAGSDAFMFAAYNGAKNSSLATGTVDVAQGPFSYDIKVRNPASYPAGWALPFTAVADVTNHAGLPSFTWNFGDGATPATGTSVAHSYALPGSYTWSVTASLGGSTIVKSGAVTIGAPVRLWVVSVGNSVVVSWPRTTADTMLQATSNLASPSWAWVTNSVTSLPDYLSVTLPASGAQFLRVSRVW